MQQQILDVLNVENAVEFQEYLKHIEEVAKKQGKTIKDFILEAIKEKIEKWENGE